MPEEIDSSSFLCDCGYQLDFAEGTIREMKEHTLRRRAGISEGKGLHAAFFHQGFFVAMYCPKAKTEIQVTPSPLAPPPKIKRAKKAVPFTHRQGQVLAFIDTYIKLNRQSPAEMDIARYFRITAPSAHQMVITLETKKLISRTPGVGRSIVLGPTLPKLPALA